MFPRGVFLAVLCFVSFYNLRSFPFCQILFRTWNHGPLRAQLRRAIPTHMSPPIETEGPVFHIELFHEQLPLPVPCYDLVPVTELTLGPTYVDTSGTPGSLDLTGGEYKT